ncbi:MAG: DUF1501 domain-containing protein [Planctomycetes bacterium]|nr:DUF1501 domain-containing protein [Planctomycetota bacterium]
MSKQAPTGRERGCIDCDGVSGFNRRNFLKAGAFGFMGLGLLDLMRVSALADEADNAKCDAVILVWLAGGPSHIDTFDPKPGQTTGGPYKPLNTSADGIQISEHLPTIARNMKHAALIRSLTSKEGSHERATYEMHTGYKPLGSIKHPSVGSMVVQQKSRRNEEIPSFISIGNRAFGAGFLGSQFAPFYIGDPNNPLRNIALSQGVDESRFLRRVNLLEYVDSNFAGQKRAEAVAEYGSYYSDAVRMMASKSRDAFDTSREKEIYQVGYGKNNFGRSLLMARRLVEAGVRFVEVTLGGWDNHNEAFEAIQRNSATLDPALGTLIEDLQARGLLKRTMVICTGEFGRTPKINAQNGRDHFPRVWSGLIAGGGLKAGYVHGSSDATGSAVKDDPVRPGDIHATMMEQLGINYTHENFTPDGRPIKLVNEGAPIKGLIA